MSGRHLLTLDLSSQCLGCPVSHQRRPQFLFGWWLLPQWQWSCHRTFYIICVCALFSGKILSKAQLQVWSGGSQAVLVKSSPELDWQQTKGKAKGSLTLLFTWDWVGRDTAKVQFLFSSTLLCVMKLCLPSNALSKYHRTLCFQYKKAVLVSSVKLGGWLLK